MRLLDVRHLVVRYGSKEAVRDVSFTLDEGQWLMIAGPNGAGKSTVIAAVSGAVPFEGEVLCLGRSVADCRPAELARNMGVLAQNHYVGYSFTVREVVGLGRYAYTKGVFGGRDERCEAAVGEALRLTGLEGLEDRSVLHLSGGELQRVFLAQLFAQEPRILLLDEPTNHLDLIYQKQLLELVTEWVKQPGRAVISVVHDLSLARAFGSEALLLKDGAAAGQGDPREVFTPELLQKTYDMDVQRWMESLLGQWKE